MKIGFAGVHGTGKSTLVDSLLKLDRFKHFHAGTGVTRWVHDLGFGINEAGNDVSQRLILMKHVYNLNMYTDIITDRSTLDTLVYSKWSVDRGFINEDTYLEAGKVWLNTMGLYNVIFYLRPEFELEDDGIRSNDKDFHGEIFKLFERAIEKYSIPVVYIEGTVEERIQQVLETLDGKNR